MIFRMYCLSFPDKARKTGPDYVTNTEIASYNRKTLNVIVIVSLLGSSNKPGKLSKTVMGWYVCYQ